MKSIWKYPLSPRDEITLNLPSGAALLCIQVQHGQPCLWALVDPDEKPTPRQFITRGTGHPISEEPGTYVGTYQLHEGRLVFHVFESASSSNKETTR